MSKNPTTKPPVLDIFQVLDHINHNDFDYYSSLEPHEQKSLHPFVLMKWLVGTKSNNQINRINNRINKYVFSLGPQHKDLLYRLLCSCTDGRSQRYSWTKSGNKKGSAMPLCNQVVQEYWGYNQAHAKDALVLLSDDAILDIAQYLGRQSDELTKIKAELKNRNK